MAGCQINPIDINVYLQKSLEIFEKKSADKFWSKKNKGIKVSPPVPNRAHTLIVCYHRFDEFFFRFLQVDDRLTLAERNERLQNQLRSLKDELSHTTVESGETTMDRIHKENVKQGRDKYKTLREVRKGNTKRRVDQFENM